MLKSSVVACAGIVSVALFHPMAKTWSLATDGVMASAVSKWRVSTASYAVREPDWKTELSGGGRGTEAFSSYEELAARYRGVPYEPSEEPETENRVAPAPEESAFSIPDGAKKMVIRKEAEGNENFVKGHCTWFVSKYRTVTWKGNAKDWYANAEKAGVPVWNVPKPGSVVVFKKGNGYNAKYGHVAIVTEVDSDGKGFRLVEMNQAWLYKVTRRWVPLDSKVAWFVYTPDGVSFE